MEWLTLFGVFELGTICGVVIMCIVQGGSYDESQKKQ